MKSWDIEKELRDEAQKYSPDKLDGILAAAQEEGLITEPVAPVRKPSRRSFYTRVGLSVAAAAACLAIVIPVSLGGLKNGAGSGGGSSPKVLSVNDVYGVGAVSTARLMDRNAPVMRARSAAVKTEAERFNGYFSALDCFFGEELVTTVSETNTDLSYPYETKLTVSGKDMSGNAVDYVMYFTETLEKQKTDGDENESEYILEGVMLVDGKSFYIDGERSFEQEPDETEDELKIRAYADKNDKKTFVQMEQEYSVEDGETEKEYVYSVVIGGTTVEKTAVKFETERKNGNEESEYELEFLQGGEKGKYKVEREIKDGETRMKVKYDLNGEKGEFEISPADNGKYEYLFPDNTTEIL